MIYFLFDGQDSLSLYLISFQEWKKEQDEEMKRKMADNNRYKQYRRYMKKGGAGQMTFGPD